MDLLEAGSPTFVVLGLEALGMSAPPTDLQELPDGRLFILGAGEVVLGDGIRWERHVQTPHTEVIETRSVAVGQDGGVYAGVRGGFAKLAFDDHGGWAWALVAGTPKEFGPDAAALTTCSMAGGEWLWNRGSGPIVGWKPGRQARVLGRMHSPEPAFVLDGAVHVSDSSTGALHQLGDQGLVERISARDTYVDMTITCGLKLPDGCHLVGTLGKGVLRYQDGRSHPFSHSQLLSGEHRINDLCQTQGGLYAAAVDNVGLVFFDQEGRILQVLDRSLDHRLARMRRLLAGRDGRIWGLLSEGVLKVEFPARVSRFEPYVSTGLVYAQPFRLQGKLWIMSDGKAQRGVYDTHGRLLRFEVDTPASYLCSMIELEGRVLACARAGIFERKEAGGWQLIEGGPVSAHIKPRPVAEKCWLYVAQDETGYLRLEDGQWKLKRFRTPGLGEAFGAVEDGAGAFWVELGTGRAARVLTGSPRPKVELFGAAQGVPEGWVQVFVLDGRARINVSEQILTYDDVQGRMVRDHEILQRIPQLEGAAGRPSKDQLGRLWITRKGRVQVFEQKDGAYRATPDVLPPDLQPLYFTPDEKGVVWLHQRMKLARFDPAMPLPVKSGVRPLVTQVQLPQSGRVLYPQGGRLEDLPPSEQTLVVNLQVSGNSLGRPVYFETLLEGLGGGWVSTGATGAASYSRLAPGDYLFRARLMTEEGPGEEVRLGFRILAPWYRSTWAYAGYVVSGGLFLWLVLWLQQRERRRLSRMVAQRTGELKQSNEELNRALSDSLAKGEALRVSEDRYRRLSENAPDIIFRIQVSGDPAFEYISPAVERVTGHPPEAFYRDPGFVADISYPKGAPSILDLAREDRLEVRLREFSWRTRDGSLRHFEERVVPVRDGAGKLLAVEGIARDITQRKERAGLINILSQAVNQNPVGVCITDLAGVIIFANQRMSLMSGFSNAELVGRDLHRLDAQLVQPEMIGELWETLESGRSWSGEFGFRRKDNEIIHARMSFSPLRDAQGVVTNYLALGEDISQWVESQERRRRLEAQLFQSQKQESLGTLAGGIAHDFNNILTGILGYCELAESNAQEGLELGEELAEVRRAGLRAKDLVSRILAFSRQTESKPVILDLSRAVDEALRLVRASTPSRIEISTDLVPGTVRADPTQIHQIVLNLCTNAVHAIGEKPGELRVCVRPVEVDGGLASEIPGLSSGPHLCLTVTDTGHGMDRETLARIFDPFFTTKRQGEGTGLGLSIVQGIVANHGGAISVSSEPGQGTCFRLFFPRAEGPVVSEPSARIASKGAAQEVLVVDDEVLVAGFMCTALRRANYRVTVCNDPREAVSLFRAEADRYAALVTDLTMPHLTGVELIGALRELRPGLPAVIVSGYSKELTRQAAAALPGTVTLGKPFGSLELTQALGQLLKT